VFESLFTDKHEDFPIDLSNYSSSKAEMEAQMEREKTNGLVKDLDMDGEVQRPNQPQWSSLEQRFPLLLTS